MKIVKFKNGKYGIRRAYFLAGYEFIDFYLCRHVYKKLPDFDRTLPVEMWWSKRMQSRDLEIDSIKIATKVFNWLKDKRKKNNDKGTVIN